MRFFTIILMLCYFTSAHSQKEIVLRLSHALNDSSFNTMKILKWTVIKIITQDYNITFQDLN